MGVISSLHSEKERENIYIVHGNELLLFIVYKLYERNRISSEPKN